MKEKREKRLNSEFRKEISEILANKVKDVRLTEMFTVTAVETTADLKQAKVFISIYSTNEARKKATFEAICAAGGFIRRELGREMHIRAVPEFTFLSDTGSEYGEKIDKILSGLNISEETNDENT